MSAPPEFAPTQPTGDLPSSEAVARILPTPDPPLIPPLIPPLNLPLNFDNLGYGRHRDCLFFYSVKSGGRFLFL